ncbi:MAG: thioredoxin-dependent thiol peroxidase [Bacteroidales bacterium]|nr:thioredoxin-dependent thiol peroxidase [Bacteroidales bacterium]
MNIGDLIPEILGMDQDGKILTRADFLGQKLALYFYPKDSTPGCTNQACDLRDHYTALQAAGYAVVGVSVDSMASHQKFIAKHALPFPLIADTDHRLVEAFGVWGEKSNYGRKYMGTFRTTFIIDEAGRVARIITPKQIKVKVHAEQILDHKED